MKLKRLAGAGAVAALVAGSTLLTGTAAVAADTYTDVDDFGIVLDGEDYIDRWFVGDVGSGAGSATTTASGLQIDGKYQFLNGNTPRTALESLVAGADMTVVDGTAHFQIPVYFEFDSEGENPKFTTLRQSVAVGDTVSATAPWTTSWAVGEYDRNSTASLSEFVTAFGEGYEVLAFGAFVDSGATATIANITWNGNTHWFTTGPITATIDAASVTTAKVKTDGVTATFSGFASGEAIYAGYSGGEWGNDLPAVQADSDGVAKVTLDRPLAIGSYTLVAVSQATGARASVPFTVVENPTPALAPQPAANPDVTLNAQETSDDETITFTVADGTFDPYEDVYAVWYSSPVFAGWFQANAAGGLTVTVAVPTAVEAGTHTFQLVGAESGTVVSSTVTVTASVLAVTGAEITPLVVSGSLLLLVGAGVLGLSARRRAARV